MIDTLTTSADKNQEYKTVNLLWNVSDHMRALAQNNTLEQGNKVWTRLFEKLLSLASHSSYGETRQVCMHTLTQILAESAFTLGPILVITSVREYYLEMFYVLLSLNNKSPVL